MIKKILGLRTCIYKVKDMDKARAWYSKAFNVAPYFDEPYYIGFNIGGFELGLQPGEEQSKKNESPVSYWGVEDLPAMYEHFLNAGATEHEAPQDVGGNIVVASVRDPWGNVIGLIFNPGFTLLDPPVH